MQVIPRPPGPQIGPLLLAHLSIITIIALGVYLIHRHDPSVTGQTKKAPNSRMRPWMITAIMFVLAFYGPISLNVYLDFGWIYIFSMTYQVLNLSTLDIVVFNLEIVMITALLSFTRPIFAYQLSRYFKGKTSRGRAIVVGVIGELQMTIVTGVVLLYLMTNPFIPFGYMIAIPIPVLLLLGLIFMWSVPVQQSQGPWKELDEPKEWWEEESEAASKAIFKEN